MKRLEKRAVLFTIGGAGYGIIEILWRGRTHWTMIRAGGICFIIFSRVAERCKAQPLVFKASLCALGVTAVELLFGVVFNIIFGMGVWDYSDQPLNFLGQICPLYTLLWAALSLVFVPVAELLSAWLDGDVLAADAINV